MPEFFYISLLGSTVVLFIVSTVNLVLGMPKGQSLWLLFSGILGVLTSVNLGYAALKGLIGLCDLVVIVCFG